MASCTTQCGSVTTTTALAPISRHALPVSLCPLTHCTHHYITTIALTSVQSNQYEVEVQALRELDQTGGIPFLRGDDACGDTRLILGSPDFSFLASYGANHSRSGSLTCSAAAGRSPSTCINKVMGY